MNVFIDLGCYNGDSVEEFKNWRKLAFPDKSDWVIHAFDANKKFLKDWKRLKTTNTHFHHKAAWTEDGVIEFAVDQSDTPLGSTLMEGKKAIWDNSPKDKVPCFDFSKWIEQFKGDYVVVKMDIEGAEFPILRKMIEDETILIPDNLMVEFHPNKVTEYTTTDKNDLILEILKLGVNILEWH